MPGPLRSYTSGQAEVAGQGRSLAELLRALDAAYPGIRFRMIDEQDRIRPHIKIFVGLKQAETLAEPTGAEPVQIICALTGG
ncbi:MAG: ubiquitin family protein [Deltaproteobacteria bacterium]